MDICKLLLQVSPRTHACARTHTNRRTHTNSRMPIIVFQTFPRSPSLRGIPENDERRAFIIVYPSNRHRTGSYFSQNDNTTVYRIVDKILLRNSSRFSRSLIVVLGEKRPADSIHTVVCSIKYHVHVLVVAHWLRKTIDFIPSDRYYCTLIYAYSTKRTFVETKKCRKMYPQFDRIT